MNIAITRPSHTPAFNETRIHKLKKTYGLFSFAEGRPAHLLTHILLLKGHLPHLKHRVLVAALDDRECSVIFVGRDALLVFGHHLQLHVNQRGRT